MHQAAHAAKSGPSSYLLQEVQRSEAEASQSQSALADVRAQLQARTAELQACKSKLALMQQDLQVRRCAPLGHRDGGESSARFVRHVSNSFRCVHDLRSYF